MLRNYFLINLLLIIIIGFLSYEFYKVNVYSVDIPEEGEAVYEKKEDIEGRRAATPPDETAFQIIAKNDLFRPSRSAPVDSVEKREISSSPPSEPPKLFGTVILNNVKTAIILDPQTAKTKSYRINETVAGYVVTDILKDRVVLKRGDETVEIKLRADKGIKFAPRRPARRVTPTRRAVQRARPRPRPVPPARNRNGNEVREPGNETDEEGDLMEGLEEMEPEEDTE